MWFDYEYLKEELIKDTDEVAKSFLSVLLEGFFIIGLVFFITFIITSSIYGLSFFHIINLKEIIGTIR